jgi:transcriptional regulator with XRE-family HTH domain
MNDEKQLKDIGERIKSLRNENGETQTTLAKAIHTTQFSISKIETGKMALTMDNLLKIANHYGVSLNYLCTGIKDNTILDILKKFFILEYKNSITGYDEYIYPVLKINSAFFEYLFQIEYLKKNYYLSAEIRSQLLDTITNTFNEQRKENAIETYSFIPMPENLLIPDEQKKEWSQIDLLRELDNHFRTIFARQSTKNE